MGKAYVDPDFPNPGGPNDAPVIIYGYTPSTALAVLGVVLFAISALWHSYQIYRWRTFYFIPVAVGCIMEVIGYTFRLLSSTKSPYNVDWFVVQYFFIVCAGVVITTGIYTILNKLIHALGRQYSVLAPRTVLIIFLVCDTVATIVQIAGASGVGAAEKARKDSSTANKVLLSGLVFQCIAFMIFLVLLSIFVHRARTVTTTTLRPFTIALLTGTALIYLRTLYRMGETAGGVGSKLSTNEVYFGTLEFAPVVLAVFIFNIWHPGKWIAKAEAMNGLEKIELQNV